MLFMVAAISTPLSLAAVAGVRGGALSSCQRVRGISRIDDEQLRVCSSLGRFHCSCARFWRAAGRISGWWWGRNWPRRVLPRSLALLFSLPPVDRCCSAAVRVRESIRACVCASRAPSLPPCVDVVLDLHAYLYIYSLCCFCAPLSRVPPRARRRGSPPPSPPLRSTPCALTRS